MYSLVYSLVYSMVHLLMYSLVYSLVYSAVYSLMYSLMYPLMYSLMYSLVYSLTYSLMYSPLYSNRRLHGIHSEEMNKLREERRMAILKLKDTLVKEHKLHMMAVTKQCQDEYREELANKRDFYEQQMTVSGCVPI